MKVLDKVKGFFKLSLYDLVLIALMVATIEAVKIALSFLPNVELVTLLIVLYTRLLKEKIIYVISIFVLLEYLQWGFSLWTVMYLYIWFILAAVAYVFRGMTSAVFWAVVTAVFGLFFGMLCSVVYIFVGGISMAFSWWVSGIPFDIIHCVSNFALTLVLFKPLDNVLQRQYRFFLGNK